MAGGNFTAAAARFARCRERLVTLAEASDADGWSEESCCRLGDIWGSQVRNSALMKKPQTDNCDFNLSQEVNVMLESIEGFSRIAPLGCPVKHCAAARQLANMRLWQTLTPAKLNRASCVRLVKFVCGTLSVQGMCEQRLGNLVAAEACFKDSIGVLQKSPVRSSQVQPGINLIFLATSWA